MAETEIIAISTTIGTSVGAVFTWLATRRRVTTDDQTAFRQDLLERVRHLEERDTTHDQRCDEKIEKALQRAEEDCREETNRKLKSLAGKLRREHEMDLAKAVEEVASEPSDE